MPDLVILDLRMPEMEGHEALAEIKNDDSLRSVQVAILSSSDYDEDVAKSHRLGGSHYITKPGDRVELEARLGKLLRDVRGLRGVRRGWNAVRWAWVSGLLIGLYMLGRVLGVL